jgi:hypothetical protein
MNINAQHAAVIAGSFGHADPASARMPVDFGIVCLWSFLGLELSALAIAFGFGADIAEILALAG